MKRLLLLFALFASTVLVSAQDTTKVATTDSSKAESKFKTSVAIATRNVTRGVNFASSPSVMAEVSYQVCSHFEVGGNGTTTTNGTAAGYGNTINLFGDVKLANHLSVRVTDYFFMGTGINDYLYEYGKGKGDGHFDEVSLCYKNDEFKVFAAYCFYSTKFESEANKGIYFEAEYNFGQGVSGTIGYISDQSALNFYSKSGFSTVALNYEWAKFGGKFKGSLIINPNYKNVTISEGVSASPATAVLSYTL